MSEIKKKDNKKDFTYRDFQLEYLFKLNSYKIAPSFTHSFITGKSFIDRIKRKIIGGQYLLETNLEFQPSINICKNNSYIEGYFQSEKYFKKYEREIRNQFVFKKALNPESELLKKTY